MPVVLQLMLNKITGASSETELKEFIVIPISPPAGVCAVATTTRRKLSQGIAECAGIHAGLRIAVGLYTPQIS